MTAHRNGNLERVRIVPPQSSQSRSAEAIMFCLECGARPPRGTRRPFCSACSPYAKRLRLVERSLSGKRRARAALAGTSSLGAPAPADWEGEQP